MNLNMWDQFLMQQGFRNVTQQGRITGFQFKIKIPYYRGLWVSSAFRDFAVRVDGVLYPKDKITLKIEDRTIPLVDVDDHYDDFWHYGSPATIVIDKPGGLEMGVHKVECGIRYDRSYQSPATPPPGFEWAAQRQPGGMGRSPLPVPPGGDPVFGTFPTACSLDMVLVI